MAKQVPGTLLMQVSNEQARLAMLAAGQGNQAAALAHLATAVQQLSGGVREALQAIYEEVE